jgi:hypothetical protein
VTFVGWIAGAIASEVVVGGPRARPRILYGVPAHAILGVLVGVAQWVVLRRRVPGAWPWVPATAAAWAASWLAIDRIEANVDDLRLAGSVGVVWWVQLTAGIALHWIAGWAPALESLAPAIARRHLVDGLWRTAPSLLIAFSGALLGAAQLPLLRRWTSRAGWWVVANVAAYGAAAWIWTMSIGERRTAAVWLGLAFPVLQWCLLRPRWKTLSPWALLCALAWPLALWRLEDDFAFIILFSTMSGLCLEWLLQEAARSRPDSLRPSALLRQ